RESDFENQAAYSALRLTNPERITLVEIGKRLGRKALKDLACVARPDTILAGYRRLFAQEFDGSRHPQYPGRLSVGKELEQVAVRMAKENPGWGYDRIVGALANLPIAALQTMDDVMSLRSPSEISHVGDDAFFGPLTASCRARNLWSDFIFCSAAD